MRLASCIEQETSLLISVELEPHYKCSVYFDNLYFGT